MVGKMPNVTWLDGSFAETVKGWQSGWFYITELRDADWAAAPEFRSGTPMRLTSWEQKGLLWGESIELTELINSIKGMKDKNIKLVNVIQLCSFAGFYRAKGGHSICGSLSRPNTRRFRGSTA